MATDNASSKTLWQRWNRIRQSTRFPYVLAVGLFLLGFFVQVALYLWGLKLERQFQAGLANVDRKLIFPVAWRSKVDYHYLAPFEPILRVNLFGHVPGVPISLLNKNQTFATAPRPVLAEDFRTLKWLLFMSELNVLGEVEADGWRSLGELHQLQTLKMTSPPNEGLKFIAKMSRLRSLTVPINLLTTGSALRELIQSPSLKNLKLLIISRPVARRTIPNIVQTDRGPITLNFVPADTKDISLDGAANSDPSISYFEILLRELSKAPLLHRLELQCRSDSMLLALTERQDDAEPPLPSLRELCIPVSQVTAKGLANLTNLPNLVHLDLSHSRINDDALLILKDLPNLRTLYLQNCSITDKGAEILSKMTRLESLNIQYTQITEIGLLKLQSLKRLRMLWLSAGPEARQKLRLKLSPLCKFR